MVSAESQQMTSVALNLPCKLAVAALGSPALGVLELEQIATALGQKRRQV